MPRRPPCRGIHRSRGTAVGGYDPWVLSPSDPLPSRPCRVAVAGVSGAGKTTLAGRIAAVIGVEHVEIDGLFHGSDWVPRPTFVADVEEFVRRDGWTTEWQYRDARPLVADRAEVLVWLDLPFWTSTFPRVVRRTVRRRRRREVLWNGNTEPPLSGILTDREHIIRWAISTRHKYGRAIPDLERVHPDLAIVRLRSQRDVERWLAGPLAAAVGAG